MKKFWILWLTVCLLLTGCGGGETPTEAEPTAPPEPFSPHYSDYADRGMTATVQSGTTRLKAMGMLNNLYEGQAAAVYETLNPAGFYKSWLKAPEDSAFVQITFRPYSDQNGETYTLYENDLAVVKHPSAGKQVCTAPAGTYAQVLAHLTGVQKEQERYFSLTHRDEAVAGYTIRYAGGKTRSVDTGTDLPQVDMVGKGLVRVLHRSTTRLYDTAKGREMTLDAATTDVGGGYVAAAEKACVALYPLFSKTAAARVWVAAGEEGFSVQGMAFSEEETQLHLICAVGESVYDRTFKLSTLKKGKTQYLVGDWEAGGGYVTEDVAQSIGYKSLKKLRHKEQELGYVLSALVLYRYDLGGVTYYLTELGHWTGDGSDRTYATDGYLMVRRDLTAGYEATPGEDGLTWHTEKNWFA